MQFSWRIAPVLVVLFALMTESSAFPQDKNSPQTTIRVLVRLVSVDVIVTDAQNAPVKDLKKEDFKIFDNGHQQEIKHFKAKASNGPARKPPPPPPSFSAIAAAAPNPMGDMRSVDPGGDPCSPEAMARAVAYLREMLAEKMAKVVDTFSMANLTTQVSYELGYYPDGDNWNGQYRHIQVSIQRPGLNVLFRQGYIPSDILPAPEIEEPLARDRIAFAISQDTDSDELPFKVSTAMVTAANGQKQTKVDLRIDARKVGFKLVEKYHADRLHIAMFYADADGNYLGEDRQTMKLQLDNDTYQRFFKSGIFFSTVIPIKTPKQMLRVVVYDVGNNKLGSKFVGIK
jgi:hypothetical protein